ncbi:hypothetical protein G6F46_002592 [Rhizopus delemar]|uniref:Uncharacterized protein n=3 Tax=Rhizopus TaxID=4842 RepID=I1BQ60_RHIO9|nr:hypothetical protein RO3G_03044 [Rhizopus delemar RA 99-880]KAG1465928.1 hypothetical protein G6F55_000820 [Rhizopus delemar]KAG1550015.1 hypothetical protein G6F51_002704 [Rhizopus arrhizus]KAG1504851.1 hypothetical protein G6F54_000716 [Rhizopus delemar]KAG1508560.1 hypothetical protein G6F53_008104 [Rhizopus delemar]|eukprot:EIE78340.1 hypothetical protein RO3G_03044 [Rhizopus delemar RA 99-880]
MTNDDSYMAMINNPVINPPRTEKQPSPLKQNTKLKPASFPPVQQAQDLLTSATQDVYLSSESDEPFEWINTITERNSLPITIDDLEVLGLLNGNESNQLKIKSVREVLQKEEYQNIVKALEKLGELTQQESKVYLVGEYSITVLILSIIHYEQQTAIVGLKSLLIQT